jgi:hypothetical protein
MSMTRVLRMSGQFSLNVIPGFLGFLGRWERSMPPYLSKGFRTFNSITSLKSLTFRVINVASCIIAPAAIIASGIFIDPDLRNLITLSTTGFVILIHENMTTSATT